MAIKQRGDCRYYYRKHKVRGRVISEYIGAGLIADLAASLDAQERERNASRRDQERARLAELDRPAEGLIAFTEAVDVLTKGVLLLSGFRQHKRQWRRRRAKD